jgi:hypothetical protein
MSLMFVPSLSWQNDLVASQENWHTKGDDFSALTELHDPIRQQKRPTADPMHQHAVEITLDQRNIFDRNGRP